MRVSESCLIKFGYYCFMVGFEIQALTSAGQVRDSTPLHRHLKKKKVLCLSFYLFYGILFLDQHVILKISVTCTTGLK